ncbi:MAG: SDR family oxidoreductase [Chloroflexi bacterium]|jgi:3-oxoacyl-[acyl-carrier protein] reductase|uniref:NAD(P)-dependent oxidoreductase n=1 Tax=Candidatus Thermofonsia Clade 3 bacterium TaxID=2364212 RepID=A0A2M8QB70_9CHLR|nr:SDR family oxidoreductase [Candidatus Roseilinea sp. NK_OTU-006]PJF47039.1 MAG: NAD(P)-dependent oxidoreductase [Candidatus Thermofonsia Clade 3 bacterium]RMG64310.1 MAG: SDR family oxidoreductase [Chloroflexota bacterium]
MMLKDRVAIVTGASREIGAAMALALAREGAAVVVSYFGEPDRAEAAAERIRAVGGRAITFRADCSQRADNFALVAAAVEAFGRLDIFVANAGITKFGRFIDYSESSFDMVADLNFKGSFFGAQAAAQQMLRQPRDDYGGRIVFSSSVVGSTAVPGLAAYGATKAAINYLAKALAAELSPSGITVNAIGIGATTNQRNLRDDPNYAENWGRVLPIGRALTPEDSAAALLYLVSPAASAVTGITLPVDGGHALQSPAPRMDFAMRPA